MARDWEWAIPAGALFPGPGSTLGIPARLIPCSEVNSLKEYRLDEILLYYSNVGEMCLFQQASSNGKTQEKNIIQNTKLEKRQSTNANKNRR
jgi:hypothetical protein